MIRSTLAVGLCLAAASPRGAAALDQAPAATFAAPMVTVTAQKEPIDVQTLPVSVTVLTDEAADDAGVRIVSDAAVYAPNTYFSEFSARKLSFARFRGIGSTPSNSRVTTSIDGVPQLHPNSSSVDLLAVGQIEFVRGPQSALFGRNTLGGLVNVNSARPSLADWAAGLFVPLGSHDARDVRGTVSGPLVAGKLGVGLALAYGRRDGFTVNDVTGRDLDYRSAFAGKGQLLWSPGSAWEARLIVSGERDRDGDYALADLDALRANPFHASRDVEGRTDRDVVHTTFLTRREGSRIALSTTTGIVRWKTADTTDLDYTAVPAIVRDNAEQSLQFTQELRIASVGPAPLRLSDSAALRWQAGVFLFTQNYEQEAVNRFQPFILSQALPLPVTHHSPDAELDDVGVGVYGQATATFSERVDVSAGVRVDHERKQALMNTFYEPAIAPPAIVDTQRNFSNVSPQASIAVHLQPGRMVYGSVSHGYAAGGFNPVSPAGSEAYGEEHTWNLEGGVKTSWAAGRLLANAAAFHTSWDDLQLTLPDPRQPAQFYTANAGAASSAGVELELSARAHERVDLFGALGYNRTRFGEGSTSSGVDVAGNTMPFTPEYTATIGAQLSQMIRPSATIYGRAEVVAYGAFQYDDLNTAGQDAYTLTNLRGGVKGRNLLVEAWVKNAFDTRYIPVAFAFGGFAPSGFVGETGRPRTFGVSVGVFR
jgi:iron complex outermembrane receptor protein